MHVDFTLLSKLPSLRKLVVGRFVEAETGTLARGLALSGLEHLEIEASFWSYQWGYMKPYVESELYFNFSDSR